MRGSIAIVLTIALTVATPQQLVAQDAKPADTDALIKQLGSTAADDQLSAAVQLAAMGPYAFAALDALTSQLKSDDELLRFECLTAIGNLGPLARKSTTQVESFLSNDSPLLQSAAIEALRRIGVASPNAMTRLRSLAGGKELGTAVSAVRCLNTLSGSADAAVSGAVPMLIQALSDKRADVRNEATTTLIALGPAASNAVLDAMKNLTGAARCRACEILGESRTSAAVPALTALLSDNDPLTVRAAATAIGAIHEQPDSTVPALVKLVSHESAAVQIVAAQALAEFGSSAASATAPLMTLLIHERAAVRAAALNAIGQVSSGDAAAVTAAVTALSDTDGAVHASAAGALSAIGAAAVPSVVELLKHDEHRVVALEILGNIGADASSAVPALLAILNDAADDPALSREVFIALASMEKGAVTAAPTMLAILKDASAGDRRAGAAYVLGRIGDAAVLPELKAMLESADSEPVKRSAAWAMVTLKPDDEAIASAALPFLTAALKSDRALARRSAAAAIGMLGNKATSSWSDVLPLASGDADSSVRIEALRALGEIGAPADKVATTVLTGLNDPNAEVRNASRYVIGRLGPAAASAAPALTESLTHGDVRERTIAAWALLRVAPTDRAITSTVPLLTPAMEHPQAEIRREVAAVLASVASKSSEAMAALKAAANDTDEQVRAIATKATGAK